MAAHAGAASAVQELRGKGPVGGLREEQDPVAVERAGGDQQGPQRGVVAQVGPGALEGIAAGTVVLEKGALHEEHL